MKSHFSIVRGIKIRKVTLPAVDIGWRDLGGFRKALVGADPTVVVYALPRVKCSGFLLIAPIDHALGVPFRVLDRQWARLALSDPEFYTNFGASLRQIGLEEGTTIDAIFGPYANFGSYLDGKRPAFKVIPCSLSMGFRIGGMVLPDSLFSSALERMLIALDQDPCSLLLVEEGQELQAAVPHEYSGIGYLYGIPCFKIASDEKISLLNGIEEFLSGGKHPDTIPGNYLDFMRGALGSSFAGPLAPLDDLDERICIARLESINRLKWTPFRHSIGSLLERSSVAADGRTVRLRGIFSCVRDQLRLVAGDEMERGHTSTPPR